MIHSNLDLIMAQAARIPMTQSASAFSQSFQVERVHVYAYVTAVLVRKVSVAHFI
jgi:hypothetical protein